MITAVDTNVLSALWNADDDLNRPVARVLGEVQEEGRMVICGVVHAELLAAAGRTEAFVDEFCAAAGINVEWELEEKIWRTAGKAFQAYASQRMKQKAGEPRRLLADFLIGAHALENDYRLLTADAVLYKTSFPRLALKIV